LEEKIMKIIYQIFLSFFVLILVGCPRGYHIDSLTFKNNSDKNIHMFMKLAIDIGIGSDTTIPVDKRGKMLLTGEYEYFDYEHTFDTLRLFILDVDTVNKYTWEQIRQDYNILARYDITRKDLYNTLTYPPNEKMKYMKMYPPYE
jgi:hypothetical protein